MAILTKYIAYNKGIVQKVGDYFAIPTYSTPSQGEVQMVGQLGESIKITMYIEYAVYQDLIFTNDLKIEIDNTSVPFNQFEITKVKTCDNDSVENKQTLQSIPTSQALSFDIHTFITPGMSFLVNEALSKAELKTQHTLTLTIGDATYSYAVVMNNCDIQGAQGGAIYAALTFSVTDEETEDNNNE